MNRHIHLFAALLGVALCAAPAAATDVEDFDAWQNRPHAPFTHGDEALRHIRERLLHDYYRADITAEDLDRAAAQGMLAYLDQKTHGWNKLLSPAEFAELKDELRGQVVGVGMMIDFDASSGVVSVNDVVPNSPAAAAGLRPGDKILSVEGQDFQGKQLRDVAAAVRGTEGTPVKLSLLRGPQVLEKTITRARITFDPVRSMMLPGGVLLLEIGGFVDTTPAAVKRALEQAVREHAKAIVVDLRDDSGGELERSVETAQLFVPKGKLITSVEKRGGKVERYLSKGDPVAPGLRLAVLVDQDTRSSAELVAAALRQNLAAPVLGTKTFGKWSVQALDELPNKYVMKYTVGIFKAPDGRSFDGEGMPPDIEVRMDSKDYTRAELAKDPASRLAADVQLRAAYNLLRLEH